MLTYQAPTSNFWSTTLNGSVNNAVDTITLTSTTGLQYPGVVVIDREDGNGTVTPNSREVISYTGISSNDLTGCTRGAESSTARSHSSGALVEAVFSVGQWNDLVDSYQVSHNDAGTHKITAFSTLALAEGQMINGLIAVSVASNNLTVALKGMDGNDPSATNPVYVRIGGVVRSITSALSVTKNAGTNWCNAGSAELATIEIDYFAYIGYNATDGVVIGFSRIPYGTLYSSFSATTTAETYCGISTITTAAAGDNYVNIGRFAATLSAGAGYTWSVPTFTATNLIQRPIYETRWLSWNPVLTGGSTDMSGYDSARYLLRGRTCFIRFYATGQTLTGTSGTIQITLPIGTSYYHISAIKIYNGAATASATCQRQTAGYFEVYKTDVLGAWVANETGVQVYIEQTYEI